MNRKLNKALNQLQKAKAKRNNTFARYKLRDSNTLIFKELVIRQNLFVLFYQKLLNIKSRLLYLFYQWVLCLF